MIIEVMLWVFFAVAILGIIYLILKKSMPQPENHSEKAQLIKQAFDQAIRKLSEEKR